MKALRDASIDLPTPTGIMLIVAAVAFVAIVALIVSRVSFNAGRRYEGTRRAHITAKRHELASIR